MKDEVSSSKYIDSSAPPSATSLEDDN